MLHFPKLNNGLLESIRAIKREGKFPHVFYLHASLKELIIKSNRLLSATLNTIFYLPVKLLSLKIAKPFVYRGHKLAKKYEAMVLSSKYSPVTAGPVFDESLENLNRALKINPALLLSHRFRIRLLTLKFSPKLFHEAGEQYHYNREIIASKFNQGDTGIRIISSHGFIRGIGYVAHLESYLKAMKLKFIPKQKLVLLLHSSQKKYIINNCILDYLRDYIEIIEDPIEIRKLTPHADDLETNLSESIFCDGKYFSSYFTFMAYVQRAWDNSKRKPLLTLHSDHVKRGKLALTSFGLPKDAWFVTLHVREGRFKGPEPFRDASIMDYVDAIDAIVERGGWVIRMGDASMPPLPPMKHVIDYAVSDIKSDWLDIYLCAACRFMIATSSGLYAIPHIFGKPFIQTNFLPTAAIFFSDQNLFIPKLLQSKDTKKILPFHKLMSTPYSFGINQGMYDNILRVNCISNSRSEIKAGALEMIGRLEGRQVYTKEDEALQKKFKKMTADVETLIGSNGAPIQCNIANDFLKTHKNLLGDQQ